jgi:hypothetical protein
MKEKLKDIENSSHIYLVTVPAGKTERMKAVNI